MFSRRSFYQWLFRTALLSGLLLPCGASAAGFVVIANKDVEVDSLSKAELQSVFLGEKVKWNNRMNIRIGIFEDKAVLNEFLQNIVGKTPAQFDTYWNRQVFTGKASMPKSFPSIAKVIEFVESKSGAISFISAAPTGGSVKIIQVR